MTESDLAAIIADMEAANKTLDGLPDDHEWTQDELSTLEDVRRATIRLGYTIEATIEAFWSKK